jgi:hypothetical protein
VHIDSSNYGDAKAGVATCDTICGDYTYIGAKQPLGFQSRDMNVFKGAYLEVAKRGQAGEKADYN